MEVHQREDFLDNKICLNEGIKKLKNNKWIAHIARASNDTLTKRLMFFDEKYIIRSNHNKTVLGKVVRDISEGMH